MREVAAKRSRGVISILLLSGLLALPASAQAYPETWVSYPALLAQVRHGDLIRVIINPLRADVEIKFRNLEEWHAYYPRAEQRELQRLVDARHVPLKFVRTHRPRIARTHATVHHHLRYIAAGVLAALVLAGGGFLLLRHRSSRHPSART
jgi:hypothetical protein